MKRILVFALCLFCSVAVVQAARVDGCACGIPAQVPTSWVIRHVDPAAQQAAMEAFSMWNQYTDVLRPTVQSSNFGLGNGISEIYFIDLTDVLGMDGASVLGFTPSLPDTAFGNFNECPVPAGTQCGMFTESDIMMNSTFSWQTTRPAPGENGLYYQATATHELGHGMGFHHNWANYSEMNYLPHFARFVSRADVLAARRQFPGQVRQVVDVATYPFTYNENAQTGSDDGANAIAVASVSPQTVAPGGKITIKNWTMENLSNGPVSQAALLFVLSTDQNITASDIALGGFKWDPQLTTWADDPTGTQFTVPASTPTGLYYVGAIAGYLVGNNFQTDNLTYNNSWVLPTPIAVGSGGTCSDSSTQVCLVGNRFQVSVQYNDGSGLKTMQAIKYTPNSGLFWFVDNSNIEVLLKMIDACSFNQKFWVYAGGTTDVEVDITVTDVRTGAQKKWTNPRGTKFGTITAGDAFSCP